MRISREDRAVIYGTDNIQQQMVQFLLSQPGHESSEESMRNVFWDVSNGLFLSTMIALETRGIIIRDSGSVQVDEANIGERCKCSDKLWKMARIEKVFTITTLADYVPEVSKAFIRELVSDWEKMGYVERKGKLKNGRSNVFMIARDSVIRPKKRKKRAADLVDAVWREVQRYARKDAIFTSRDLLKAVPISSRYLADLLRQWSTEELIVKVLAKRGRRELEIYKCPYLGDRTAVITRSRSKEGKDGKKRNDKHNPCKNIEAV